MTKTRIAVLAATAVAGFGLGSALPGEAPEPTRAPVSAPAPDVAAVESRRVGAPEVLTREEEIQRAAGLAKQARIRKRLNELREESAAARREHRLPNLNVNDGGAP